MNPPSLRLLGAFAIALWAAGCAGSRDIAVEPEPPPPHPLAGEWTYAVDTPQGLYTGSIVFSMEGDSLMGALTMDMSPGDLLEFGATYDSETGEVSFSFDSGEFGIMDVSLTLEEGALSGQQFIRDYSMHLDVTASRKEEGAAQ